MFKNRELRVSALAACAVSVCFGAAGFALDVRAGALVLLCSATLCALFFFDDAQTLSGDCPAQRTD